MSDYRPTIGLEIHAELATRTKMFCDCMNAPEGAAVNANTCPVCMAHPGTLPTINKEAVRHVLRVGTAIKGKLADFAEFDRKSYFYPDIPKGYQISQYEHPLIAGGELAGVSITRIHLEEDTARSSHDGGQGVSLVDFNRAGVPLMELVTEPVIHDAETAGKFARELQLLLRTLGASHANLEKGEMRVEANISVSKDENFGTKVEVKNLNSFRSVERAIAYEISRQSKVLEEGGVLTQETRGWDEGGQKTFSQRAKEGSADYRYFPEPDLPKLLLSEVPDLSPEVIASSMPELPWERRARYTALGLKDADAAQLSASVARAVFFDKVITISNSSESLLLLAANYLISDVAGWYSKTGKEEFLGLDEEAFVELMQMIEQKDLSSRGAKDVLLVMLEKGGSPREIAEQENLLQVSDEAALGDAVRTVVKENSAVVAEYKAGKEASLQYLVGQGMKATKGAGNPALIKELLVKEIG
ncbi:Asp-tRNA(Asn)/Glu-tRNA(Gln) amidotransferase subunit GatB [Patescibacteria group bacterium]|nr:Asp-tRNA(Asn)/Glu-tRNA(Gln) amidotransferase subunit GatB [Patescibacteria group bacterium]MBU2158935.1 Asp-tRNA(Asn)/Glu-tRNA(Gln) amidotransferase subunit GatB [Patescibacteria group bacterium]